MLPISRRKICYSIISLDCRSEDLDILEFVVLRLHAEAMTQDFTQRPVHFSQDLLLARTLEFRLDENKDPLKHEVMKDQKVPAYIERRLNRCRLKVLQSNQTVAQTNSRRGRSRGSPGTWIDVHQVLQLLRHLFTGSGNITCDQCEPSRRYVSAEPKISRKYNTLNSLASLASSKVRNRKSLAIARPRLTGVGSLNPPPRLFAGDIFSTGFRGETPLKGTAMNEVQALTRATLSIRSAKFSITERSAFELVCRKPARGLPNVKEAFLTAASGVAGGVARAPSCKRRLRWDPVGVTGSFDAV